MSYVCTCRFTKIINGKKNYRAQICKSIIIPIFQLCLLFPHLSLSQVGDAKDAVRKGVRFLFRELCSFYPPAKLFGFVLDGLKSKNARQRTGEWSTVC